MYTSETKKLKTFQVTLTVQLCSQLFNMLFLVYEEVFSSDDEDEDEDSKWFDINVTEDHLDDFHFR